MEEKSSLEELLKAVSTGELDVETAADQLRSGSPSSVEGVEDLCLDLDRSRRCGFPEAIYAPGKRLETLREAFTQLHLEGQHALATRVSHEQIEEISLHFPGTIVNEEARTVRLMAKKTKDYSAKQSNQKEFVPYIITAGSTDRAVAEEAAETLRWMEIEPKIIFDVGVAGPQRLLSRVNELQKASLLIVVAGMEGALPSVVGGWVSCPVIAVPTSVGYGANLGGISALLSMLNSCAANVCTVNIDAGFKAGYLAGLIGASTNS